MGPLTSDNMDLPKGFLASPGLGCCCSCCFCLSFFAFSSPYSFLMFGSEKLTLRQLTARPGSFSSPVKLVAWMVPDALARTKVEIVDVAGGCFAAETATLLRERDPPHRRSITGKEGRDIPWFPVFWQWGLETLTSNPEQLLGTQSPKVSSQQRNHIENLPVPTASQKCYLFLVHIHPQPLGILEYFCRTVKV